MSDYLNKYVTGPINHLGSYMPRFSSTAPKQTEKIIETIVKHEYQQLEPFGYKNLPRISRYFLKIAAISGLTAVVMSAYGSHIFNKRQDTTRDMRELYFTAQYYHLVHSVALLSLPIVKRPKLTGTLWLSGLFLFCGTMYYHALTNDNRFRTLTPYGGFCLIAGWLSIFF